VPAGPGGATPTDTTNHDVAGINPGPVTEWFAAHVPDVCPPLRFDLITGGHSNLTFRVGDAAGGRWVLRRPPLGQVLATAHDMAREHRIISALGPTDVPVPPVVGMCDDESVNGAPFYVMDFVDGDVVRSPADAAAMSPEARSRAGESLVEVLARIHAVDLDDAGLDDLARHDGYLERQLRRWQTQLENSRTRDLPVMDEVHATLVDRLPPQGPATLVHGDYRLDNCMLGPHGDVAAVLDWELCTLGDPLADVGLLLVYWADPDTGADTPLPSATTLDGFPTRSGIAETYQTLTGRDLGGIDYYVAFGYWKLACILEGVHSRYQGGAMGERKGEDVSGFGNVVLWLANAAKDAVSRLEGP
jgi:aminoglycoside phosphotransferase (APT) family kinase protein